MQPKINVQDCLIGILAGLGIFVVFWSIVRKIFFPLQLGFEYVQDFAIVTNVIHTTTSAMIALMTFAKNFVKKPSQI